MKELKQKMEDLGFEQCIMCEGFHPHDKIQDRGEPTCDHCCEQWDEEIKKTGIEHLDEYLDSRKIQDDFYHFASAKWSGVTEEELKEMEG